MSPARNLVAKHAPKAGAGRHLDKRKRMASRKPKHKGVSL
jgi:hypothetical protein